jgi:N4-(beta-N-acetylglucosaminyl)-L-asparaginase
MPTRRSFMSHSLLAMLPFASSFSSHAKVSGPAVISTWDFGFKANEAAWQVLVERGGRSLDAVEQGVRVTEADPKETTVGYGGLPDREGHVTLDACIMDELGNAGSVACLQHIKHPISVARKVMEDTPHVMLVGEGALKFALSKGFKKENLLTPESQAKWKEWQKTETYAPAINVENHDTIGMLAIDAKGNIAGACTTSGMAFKMHGRVGDSPIIGAGLFIDNAIGGAAATGLGEEVMRVVGSHLVVEFMRQGFTPQKACMRAVERIYEKNPTKAKSLQVGFIAINKHGEFGAYALQKKFTYAVRNTQKNELLSSTSFF